MIGGRLRYHRDKLEERNHPLTCFASISMFTLASRGFLWTRFRRMPFSRASFSTIRTGRLHGCSPNCLCPSPVELLPLCFHRNRSTSFLIKPHLRVLRLIESWARLMHTTAAARENACPDGRNRHVPAMPRVSFELVECSRFGKEACYGSMRSPTLIMSSLIFQSQPYCTHLPSPNRFLPCLRPCSWVSHI